MKVSSLAPSSLLLCACTLPCLPACVSRSQQCDTFTETANDSQLAFREIPGPRTVGGSSEIRASVAELEALQLTDEKLSTLRDRWAEGLEAMARDIDTMSGALESAKRDPDNEPEALSVLQDAGEQFAKHAADMNELVDEVKAYCEN